MGRGAQNVLGFGALLMQRGLLADPKDFQILTALWAGL